MLVQEWLLDQTSADAVARCLSAGVPASRIYDIGEVVEEAMAGSRGTFIECDTHQMLDAPFRFSRSLVGMEALAPTIGQHNDEVYGNGLGLSGTESAMLKAKGVI